ncbi:MAG: serine/threonine-protein kinase Nek [archaeon]|nr:serine/threonine-protein kinase Nek [archaeon]
MSSEDFELGKELGKGAFGSVFIVKRKIDKKIYAMKRVRIAQLSRKDIQNSLNEIRILASLQHNNIIGYNEAFFEESSKTLNIVMEYADDGDVSSKIKYNIKHGLMFKEKIVWDYLIQILTGLKFLHDNKIIHRDLKSANLFLMKDGTLKIGDLNVSKITKLGMAYTQAGTPYYASPEIWRDKPYDYKTDIWSVGCIIYELCMLKPPFRGTSLKDLCNKIQRGSYNPLSKFYSKELSNIVSLMIRHKPEDRPSAEQLLKSDIIQNKIKELRMNKESNGFELKGKVNLINTIKIPKNLKEINRALPMKRYKNREEMLEHDEYETKKNGFFHEREAVEEEEDIIEEIEKNILPSEIMIPEKEEGIKSKNTTENTKKEKETRKETHTPTLITKNNSTNSKRNENIILSKRNSNNSKRTESRGSSVKKESKSSNAKKNELKDILDFFEVDADNIPFNYKPNNIKPNNNQLRQINHKIDLGEYNNGAKEEKHHEEKHHKHNYEFYKQMKKRREQSQEIKKSEGNKEGNKNSPIPITPIGKINYNKENMISNGNNKTPNEKQMKRINSNKIIYLNPKVEKKTPYGNVTPILRRNNISPLKMIKANNGKIKENHLNNFDNKIHGSNKKLNRQRSESRGKRPVSSINPRMPQKNLNLHNDALNVNINIANNKPKYRPITGNYRRFISGNKKIQCSVNYEIKRNGLNEVEKNYNQHLNGNYNIKSHKINYRQNNNLSNKPKRKVIIEKINYQRPKGKYERAKEYERERMNKGLNNYYNIYHHKGEPKGHYLVNYLQKKKA